MQRVGLAFLRFCLSAWVGIAIFFVMVIVDLRNSELFAVGAKNNHPKVLFPLYYSFEFALLGTALLCAAAGMWNARMGFVRRLAVLGFLGMACGLAALDYSTVYRRLAEMMAAGQFPAAQFVTLHQLSKALNEIVLGLSLLTAGLVLWPEKSDSPSAATALPR